MDSSSNEPFLQHFSWKLTSRSQPLKAWRKASEAEWTANAQALECKAGYRGKMARCGLGWSF